MKTSIIHLFLVGLLLFSARLVAQEIPAAPNPPRLVNDLAQILTADEVNTLERHLVNNNDTTSTQILVVTVTDLGGYEAADFAFRLGEKWGVGKKGSNNGVVILVKPELGNSNGKAFIATGYGLESVIPDALAKRIVEQEMIPFFKQGDYYGGIKQAVQAIIGLASGQYTADKYEGKRNGSPVIIIIIIIILIVIFKSRGNSTNIGSGGSSGFLWTALWLASMANRNHGGSWGGFSGGSGGFGGGGGGGFGGFGGGSFGGGGAGGSW